MVTSYGDSIMASEQFGRATEDVVAERKKVILEVTMRRFGQLLAEGLLTACALLGPRLNKKGNAAKPDGRCAQRRGANVRG